MLTIQLFGVIAICSFLFPAVCLLKQVVDSALGPLPSIYPDSRQGTRFFRRTQNTQFLGQTSPAVEIALLAW